MTSLLPLVRESSAEETRGIDGRDWRIQKQSKRNCGQERGGEEGVEEKVTRRREEEET